MDEILKELDVVYQIISSIPVTHDSIDAMASARYRLRKVHSLMQELKIESPGEEQNDE